MNLCQLNTKNLSLTSFRIYSEIIIKEIELELTVGGAHPNR